MRAPPLRRGFCCWLCSGRALTMRRAWCGQVMASHEHNAVVVSMGTTAGKPEDTGCEPTWENVREAIASAQQL